MPLLPPPAECPAILDDVPLACLVLQPEDATLRVCPPGQTLVDGQPCDHDTISSAIAVADADDFVYVAAGTYEETLDIDHDIQCIVGAGVVSGQERPLLISPITSTEPVLRVHSGAKVLLSVFSVINQGQLAFEVVEDSSLTELDVLHFAGGRPVADAGVGRVEDSTLRLGSVAMRDGLSSGKGGFLYASNSDVTLQFVEMNGGLATESGGAIYMADSHLCTTGLRLVDNVSLGSGGGLTLQGDSSAEIYSSTFTGNEAQRFGGAVYSPEEVDLLDNPQVELWMVGPVFRENRAVGGGGAISVQRTDLQLKGLGFRAAFTRNTSEGIGGAVRIGRGSLEVVEADFEENECEGSGGAVFVSSMTAVALSDVRFMGNVAGGNGGAVGIGNVDTGNATSGFEFVEVSGVRACGNIAGHSGGAIDLSDVPSASFVRSLFVDNRAENNGGAIAGALSFRDLSIEQSSFVGNTDAAGAVLSIPREASATVSASMFTHSQLLFDGRATLELRQNAYHDVMRGRLGGFEDNVQLNSPIWRLYSDDGDCDNDRLYASYYGPTIDVGNATDPDGSRSDIGYFGGLGTSCDEVEWAACDAWIDNDGDGWPVLYDCDDIDPAVFPTTDPANTHDVWYDGIDSDCDGANDFDQDGDGYPMMHDDNPDAVGPFDCDDTNAAYNPGVDKYAADADGNPVYPYGPVVGELGPDCAEPLEDFDRDGAKSDQVEGGTDCDDLDPFVRPGALDVDPTRDLNCDGRVDVSGTLQVGGATCATAPRLSVWTLLVAVLFAHRRRATKKGSSRGL